MVYDHNEASHPYDELSLYSSLHESGLKLIINYSFCSLCYHSLSQIDVIIIHYANEYHIALVYVNDL